MTKLLIMGLVLAALLLPNAGFTEFDREACYGKCRGVPLRFGHLPGQVILTNLAQANVDACIQECERRFWADFEKKTKDPKEKD